MKKFIHVLLDTGHLYEIPASVIAQNRAKTMLEMHPEEFADLAAAELDTDELFEDSDQIRDWGLNQMNVPELMKEARLVRYTPPEQDFAGGEWSYHEHAAMIPQLETQTMLAMPVEMAVAAMAAHRNLCQVLQLNAEDGQPYAAVVLIQGGPAIVGTYVGALTHLTNVYVQPAPGQLPS